ncbi:hypothetical protein NEOC65_002182 [Neochlamydia sp. AcF65]|nr:hypothetical protein [Neochlamydia sp. AcF65]
MHRQPEAARSSSNYMLLSYFLCNPLLYKAFIVK